MKSYGCWWLSCHRLLVFLLKRRNYIPLCWYIKYLAQREWVIRLGQRSLNGQIHQNFCGRRWMRFYIARDDRRSRECNPVTPVESVSLLFRTHPCVLAFITHILCINGVEMTFFWLIWFNLRYILFKFAICFIALMNLGETCHLKRRHFATVWKTMLLLCLLPLWLHAGALWRHAVLWRHTMQQHYDVTQCINGL